MYVFLDFSLFIQNLYLDVIFVYVEKKYVK